MIDHVIVGLDEGSLADHAVGAAVHLSQELGAQLDVLHAVASVRPTWIFEDESHWARVQAEATSHARAACLERLGSIEADVDFESALHVAVGRPSEILTQHARDHAAALIVLGAHKGRGLFDFGGTTREVLHDLRCPVWLQTRAWRPVERILCPIDLSPGSSKVFEIADALRRAFAASLEVIYCFEPPRSSYGFQPKFVVADYRKSVETHVAQFLERVADSTVSSRVIDGEPAMTILGMQESTDLIVMGTHGHSAYSQVMLGSQAYRVLRGADAPVVAVPQERREAIS